MGDNIFVDLVGIVVGIVLLPTPAAPLGNAILAVSLGSLAGKILAPDVRKPRISQQGFKQIGTGGTTPRRIVYGTRAISGPVVFIETSGDDTRVMHLIIALTTHPVEDITHVILNDDVIRISGSPEVTGLEGNDLNTHHFINKLDDLFADTYFGEINEKWTRDALTAGNSNSLPDYAEAPIRIVKCNGWATAKNNLEHTGNSIYIPNATNPPSGNWFLQDVKQQKMITAYAGDSQLTSLADANAIKNQTTTAYFEGGTVNGAGERWTETTDTKHRLTNCSYVYVRLLYNSENQWQSSIPNFKFIVKGKRVYDPTDDIQSDYYSATSPDERGNPFTRGWQTGTDLTSGTQRFDDPVTWKHTSNWATCILDYLLDEHYGLGARTNGPAAVYDTGELFDEIDWASFAQAITESDEIISNGAVSPDNVSMPKYSLNAVIETEQTPLNIIETMLLHGLGFLVYSEGKYTLYSGVYTPPSSPDNIIDESFLAEGDLVITTGKSRSELFNKAAGTYIQAYNPDSTSPVIYNISPYGMPGFPVFEAADFPMVDPKETDGITNPYEAEDGEEIVRQFEFPYCTNEFQAQYIAKLLLQRNRESLAVTGIFKPKILKYKVGDTIYMTLKTTDTPGEEIWKQSTEFDDPLDPNYGSFSYKQFKIVSMIINNDLTVEVVLNEEHSRLYDWNDGDAIPLDVAANTSLKIAKLTQLPPEPSWEVSSPHVPLASDVKIMSDGSTTTITTIQWEKGPGTNKHPPLTYELEYGAVTDAGATDPAQRVADWIVVPRIPVNKDRLRQGPVELTGLINAADPANPTAGIIRYEFRVRAISIYGKPSDWVYFMDSTFAPTDGLGYQVYVDIFAPPVPVDMYTNSEYGRHYFEVTVDLTDNTETDNAYLKILVSKTINDPLDSNSQEYIIVIPKDFSVLDTASKTVKFNIEPPDGDVWYLWAGVFDTSDNGPTITDYDQWYPSGVTTWGNGEVGQVNPLYTNYIKAEFGTGIEIGVADVLKVQAMRVAPQIPAAPITSGNIQLYTAASADSSGIILQDTPLPPAGSEYLWENIGPDDISGNLTVYLADATTTPYTLDNPLIYDEITLSDTTDIQNINGYYDGNTKLQWNKDNRGNWVDTTGTYPRFHFFWGGIEQAWIDIYFELDQDSETITVDFPVAGWYNGLGGSYIEVIINGESPSITSPIGFPVTDYGAAVNVEVIYHRATAVGGDSFTISETWFVAAAGPIGAKLLGVKGNTDTYTSTGGWGNNDNWLYLHGFTQSGTPDGDITGEIKLPATDIIITGYGQDWDGFQDIVKGAVYAGLGLPTLGVSPDSGTPDVRPVTEGWILAITDPDPAPWTFDEYSTSSEYNAAAVKSRGTWYYQGAHRSGGVPTGDAAWLPISMPPDPNSNIWVVGSYTNTGPGDYARDPDISPQGNLISVSTFYEARHPDEIPSMDGTSVFDGDLVGESVDTENIRDDAVNIKQKHYKAGPYVVSNDPTWDNVSAGVTITLPSIQDVEVSVSFEARGNVTGTHDLEYELRRSPDESPPTWTVLTNIPKVLIEYDYYHPIYLTHNDESVAAGSYIYQLWARDVGNVQLHNIRTKAKVHLK